MLSFGFTSFSAGGAAGSAQAGILYTNANNNGIQLPHSSSFNYNPPSFKNYDFKVTSASLSFELSVQESIEFGLSIAGVIDLFTASYTLVQGTAQQFSYGALTSSHLSVQMNTPATSTSTTTSASASLEDASAGATKVVPSVVVPGDAVSIRVEYEQLPINEPIVMFYSLYNGISRYSIGQQQFNTSATGSGVFEFDWIVPWDKTFENNDIWQAVVHSSAMMERKYFSLNEVNVSVFTEVDSIFIHAPADREVVLLDDHSHAAEYALSWNSSLVRYFDPILGTFKHAIVICSCISNFFLTDQL